MILVTVSPVILFSDTDLEIEAAEGDIGQGEGSRDSQEDLECLLYLSLSLSACLPATFHSADKTD